MQIFFFKKILYTWATSFQFFSSLVDCCYTLQVKSLLFFGRLSSIFFSSLLLFGQCCFVFFFFWLLLWFISIFFSFVFCYCDWVTVALFVMLCSAFFFFWFCWLLLCSVSTVSCIFLFNITMKNRSLILCDLVMYLL